MPNAPLAFERYIGIVDVSFGNYMEGVVATMGEIVEFVDQPGAKLGSALRRKHRCFSPGDVL